MQTDIRVHISLALGIFGLVGAAALPAMFMPKESQLEALIIRDVVRPTKRSLVNGSGTVAREIRTTERGRNREVVYETWEDRVLRKRGLTGSGATGSGDIRETVRGREREIARALYQNRRLSRLSGCTASGCTASGTVRQIVAIPREIRTQTGTWTRRVYTRVAAARSGSTLSGVTVRETKRIDPSDITRTAYQRRLRRELRAFADTGAVTIRLREDWETHLAAPDPWENRRLERLKRRLNASGSGTTLSSE